MYKLISVQLSMKSRSRSVCLMAVGRVHYGEYVFEVSLA